MEQKTASMGIEEEAEAKGLNADIQIIAAFVTIAMVAFFFAWFALIMAVLIFGIAFIAEFFGFGRGDDRVLNKGSHSLHNRHGLDRNILRQGICYDRRWYGRYLHAVMPRKAFPSKREYSILLPDRNK
jgi:hypothetical protein